MSLPMSLHTLFEWITGKPHIDPHDLHQNVRDAVHHSRHMAQRVVSSAFVARKHSDMLLGIAQEAIARMEAARDKIKCGD